MTETEMVERVAAHLWRAEATDSGTPASVARGRTPEAFRDQSSDLRGKWLKLARAAIEAMRGMKPSDLIVDRFDDDNLHMTTYHCIAQSWDMMIEEVIRIAP